MLAAWWLGLAAIYLLFDANEWIVLGLFAFTLPSLYDIGANSTARLDMDMHEIRWQSGKRGARLPRAQLKSVRLDTRLDLSLRMTLITTEGGKIRLPYECIPKAADIEEALSNLNIPFERHHFTLLG